MESKQQESNFLQKFLHKAKRKRKFIIVISLCFIVIKIVFFGSLLIILQAFIKSLLGHLKKYSIVSYLGRNT